MATVGTADDVGLRRRREPGQPGLGIGADMPNNVGIRYNLDALGVDSASAEEILGAVKQIRAANNFSMDYWVSHMRQPEADGLMKDMLGVAHRLGERLRRSLPWEVFGSGCNDRQIGERLRSATSIAELDHDDQVRIITSSDGLAALRFAPDRARLEWLTHIVEIEQAKAAAAQAAGLVELTREVAVEVNAQLGERAATSTAEMAREVAMELNAQLGGAVDDAELIKEVNIRLEARSDARV